MDHCYIILFDENVTIYINGKTKSDIMPTLKHDGDNLKRLAKEHKMQIHYDKTPSCMTLGTRQKTKNEESKQSLSIDKNISNKAS